MIEGAYEEMMIGELKRSPERIESLKAKKKDKETLIKELEKQMKEAAKALDFERAMELRDMMLELQGEV